MPASLHRAYSLITIKSVNDAQRELTGIATTPTPDRMDDIVEPEGAQFQLPIPLLWQHDAKQPIGEVYAATVTAKGIEIKARLAKIEDPGQLKDRLDMAWQSIKSGLVKGLSIGFSAIETADIKGSYGVRFLKWMWLELSAVTIPANAEASILTVRSLDAAQRAATGAAASITLPGVSGVSRTTVRTRSAMRKTYAEQIADIKNQIQTKQSDAEAIQTKATDEGRTKDAQERESFEALNGEIEALEKELVDLERLEARAKTLARPVAVAPTGTAVPFQHVSVKENRDKGIGFARLVMCKMAAFLSHYEQSAEAIAKARYPSDTELHMAVKNTVAGGLTTDTTWAQPLAYPALASEFVEYLRPLTIIGKFGSTVNGVTYPSLTRLPFNVKVNRETSVGTGYWVGEGKPVPVSKEAFDAITMAYTKVGALTVISKELARFSTPSAEMLVRNSLVKSTVQRIDTDLIDPDKAVSAGVNPASLTNGLTGLTTAGTSADNVRTDVIKLIAAFQQPYNLDPANLVLVMPNTLCMALSVLATSLGTKQFPSMGITGGYLEGIPVIGSQYAASGASYGNMVIGIDTSSVGLADDGEVSVDISTEAALEMLDNPTNALTPTATSMVSLWQTNSIGIKTERMINWQKLRTGAVAFFDDVNWGAVGSPY